jgi:tetratricopeptide (TPR) repeat protein
MSSVSLFAQRLIRFGAVGVVCAVVAAGALYLFNRTDTATPAPGAAEPAGQASKARQPIDTDDELVVPNEAASDQALRLVGEARRLADDGKFTEAKAKLDQADKVVPGLSEVSETRRKIAELSTPQGQLATQLGRARTAIDNDEAVEAEKALAEAERLSPQAPEIAALRQALQAAQQTEARRHGRIVELLETMRSAIVRHDIAGADGALNEASRLDVRDPLLDQARTELARAHDEERKRELAK